MGQEGMLCLDYYQVDRTYMRAIRASNAAASKCNEHKIPNPFLKRKAFKEIKPSPTCVTFCGVGSVICGEAICTESGDCSHFV
ncbi:hypothetical protein LguiA_029264 [Lonicera macranthoides]